MIGREGGPRQGTLLVCASVQPLAHGGSTTCPSLSPLLLVPMSRFWGQGGGKGRTVVCVCACVCVCVCVCACAHLSVEEEAAWWFIEFRNQLQRTENIHDIQPVKLCLLHFQNIPSLHTSFTSVAEFRTLCHVLAMLWNILFGWSKWPSCRHSRYSGAAYTDRQTDRRTDIQTHTHTQRQTDTYTHTHVHTYRERENNNTAQLITVRCYHTSYPGPAQCDYRHC